MKKLGIEAPKASDIFVSPDASLSPTASVGAGTRILGRVTVEDDVRIGENVLFATWEYGQQSPAVPHTVVSRGAIVGAGSVIYPGVTIGRSAVVLPGSVVQKPVPPAALVEGNPATICGFRDAETAGQPRPGKAVLQSGPDEGVGVSGVRAIELPLVKDLRGSLAVAEFPEQLPFQPRRVFLVFDVPSRHIRGEHAHRSLWQLLICVRGGCSIVVDDGRRRAEVTLDRPSLGLLIPPMVWTSQYRHTTDSMLLVLASDQYDPNDYIRDYGEFLKVAETSE